MSILSRSKWETIRHKKDLIGEEALAAVRRLGGNLQFVKEQTPEICLAAVITNGYALRYVREQTREICLAAVKQNSDALRFVEERFLDEDKIIMINGKKYRLVED